MQVQDLGAASDDGSATAAGSLPALKRLLDELTGSDVRFCLWKSNIHLPQALAGETDLDLLVDRAQRQRFHQVLARHPVIPIVPAPAAAYPGTEHLLGFDEESGRLFHLHVHYQLILGERYVKGYRLPLEEAFLTAPRLLLDVPVPRAEAELAVLLVRALVKYRGRDVVKDLLGIRYPGIPDEMQGEIRWLLAQTTPEQVRAFADATGVVPADAIGRLLDVVATAPRSGYALLQLRTQLRAALAPYQRYGRVRALATYLAGVAAESRWVGRPRDMRMTPLAGGFTFALVGADGAGKSTLAESLAGWLRWKLDAEVSYMGSKQPSRRSSWLYLTFRMARRAERGMRRRWDAAVPVRGVAAVRDVLLASHHLSIGRDRQKRYRQAQRDVVNGKIIVFDRYPLERLSGDPEHRLLDGPQIAAVLPQPRTRLLNLLAGVEERLYRAFRLPDHLAVLEVSPAASLARKPDHNGKVLSRKSTAATQLATLAQQVDAPVHVSRVDANRPLAAVLHELKAKVWHAL